MNSEEYQKKTSLTLTDYEGVDLSSKRDMKMINMLLGLSGEVGELIDHYKKFYFHKHDLNRDNVIKELGDIMWYLAIICEDLDTTFEEVMDKNHEKLKNRYGTEFTAEKSKNRVA